MRVAAVGVFLFLGTLAVPARGERRDVVEGCASAAETAEPLVAKGDFATARPHLTACLQPQCPDAVRRVCEALSEEMHRLTPRFSVALLDARAKPVPGAHLWVDGKDHGPLPRTVALDPGAHRLQATFGDRTAETRVVAHAGEPLRIVELSLPSPSPEATEPGARKPPFGTFVLATLGVLGLGSGTYFGVRTLSMESDALRECAPNCPSSRIDDMRLSGNLSTLSFAISLTALASAAALYFLASRPSSDR